MMFLAIMLSFAFVFMVFMAYFVISLISNFVFGYKEWKVKRGYETELAKNVAVLPLKWKEERLQKWYVLIAIIFCGLIWMPSFTTLWQVNEVNVLDVNPIRPTATPTITGKYGIPEPYYQNVEKGNKNISELRGVLEAIVLPHKYEKGVWDCGESSAYVERILENEGFDTVIYANYSQGHAWVVSRGVWSNNKQYDVAIECMHHPFIATLEFYNHPGVICEDIYEAMEECQYEFDWWVQA